MPDNVEVDPNSAHLVETCLAEEIALEGTEGMCAQPCLVERCTLRLKEDPKYGLVRGAGDCAMEEVIDFTPDELV